MTTRMTDRTARQGVRAERFGDSSDALATARRRERGRLRTSMGDLLSE